MNAEKQKEDSCTFSQIKTQRRILINKQFQEESSLFLWAITYMDVYKAVSR